MTTWNHRTVGQLVVERPARARVFERLGIDYCCGGRLPLAEACAKRGLQTEDVTRQIREDDAAGDGPGDAGRDWAAATASALADHIETTHHAMLKRELPRLAAMTARVAEVHGSRNAGLVQLRNVFEKFARELNSHMAKEERVLFPWIRVLESGADAPAGVGNPVAQMIHEHDDAGEDLAKMRALTNDYTPPMDACGTWRATLDGLRQLEADMHQHVHKENNILFPRAMEIERARGGAPGASCSCGPRCCGG